MAGRLIISTSGVISEHALNDEDCNELAQEGSTEIESAWTQFWRDGRRPIIESKAPAPNSPSEGSLDPFPEPPRRFVPPAARHPEARWVQPQTLAIVTLAIVCVAQFWLIVESAEDWSPDWKPRRKNANPKSNRG